MGGPKNTNALYIYLIFLPFGVPKVFTLKNCFYIVSVRIHPQNSLKGLKGVIKAGIKELLQSGQLNSWWWISQPLDLFVFCGSSLSPPSTTPLSPLTPLISPTLTIQSPNPSSPLALARLTQFPDFPPSATVPGCPSHLCRDPRHVGNGHGPQRTPDIR